MKRIGINLKGMVISWYLPHSPFTDGFDQFANISSMEEITFCLFMHEGVHFTQHLRVLKYT